MKVWIVHWNIAGMKLFLGVWDNLQMINEYVANNPHNNYSVTEHLVNANPPTWDVS